MEDVWVVCGDGKDPLMVRNLLRKGIFVFLYLLAFSLWIGIRDFLFCLVNLAINTDFSMEATMDQVTTEVDFIRNRPKLDEVVMLGEGTRDLARLGLSSLKVTRLSPLYSSCILTS